MRALLKFIACALSVSTLAQAETTDWAANQVLPLEKLSVGPWDNYDASVSNDDQVMYFTRDLNQVPNIYKQNLPSTETELLIGKEGDAKQFRISPDQKLVAYTSYGKDALGDICYDTMQLTQKHCITPKQQIAHTPFWVGNTQLAYIARESGDQVSALMLYNLADGKSRELYRGDISAPVLVPPGDEIIFVSSSGVRSEFYRLSVEDSSRKPMPVMDLPGKTGYASFSHDGKYYYFNHYLNDTNGDQRIDGNDHSVVFRADYTEWKKSKKAYFPEQLISVDNNCTFPRLSQKQLYVTCAFEGSLDIYRLPMSGSIPEHWKLDQLWEAHSAARSYEQRLLLLNRIKYQTRTGDLGLNERLLVNHLQLRDYTASRFYIQKILQSTESVTGNKSNFYRILEKLLDASSLKQRVPRGEMTARYELQVKKIQSQLHDDSEFGDFISLVDVYLLYELEQYDAAREKLKQIKLAQLDFSLQKHILAELTAQLFSEVDQRFVLSSYRALLDDAKLDEQSRLYYAYRYLQLLSNVEKDVSRIATALDKLAESPLESRITDLVETERLVYKLIAEADDAKKNSLYSELTKLLKKQQRDVRLRHAMHSRAIRVLGEHEEYKFLELMSRHWLQVTNIKEIEFATVAEQYSVITLDKAYGLILDKELAKAYSVFYSAIRQTNDLEAHYQFIRLGLNPELNKRDNLDSSYELLNKQQILGQAANYVRAMRSVYEMEMRGNYDEKVVLTALQDLRKMSSIGSGASMRDLLLGYLYHIQLRHGKKGYAYDKTLYQKAHYHYMMALDLEKNNGRVVPVTLNNLAWLQVDVRQYAMAEGFFRKRLQFPFVSEDDEYSTRWTLARSLYYTNQHLDAAAQITQIQSRIKPQHGLAKALDERRAFYLMNGGDYKKAVEIYQRLDSKSLDIGNQIRIQNAYAYSLMKNGQTDSAREAYRRLLELTRKGASRKADNLFLLAYDSDRQALLAHGFLATLETDASQRIQHLRSRIDILEGLKGKTDVFAMDEASRLVLIAKDYQKLVLLNEQEKNKSKMFENLSRMLDTITVLAEELGDYLSPSVSQGLYNGLTLIIQHAGEVDKSLLDRIQKLTQGVEAAYAAISQPSESDRVEHFHFSVLNHGVAKHAGLMDASAFESQLNMLLNSDLLKAATKAGDERLQQSVRMFQRIRGL